MSVADLKYLLGMGPKASHRRSRHRREQMKYFSGPKFRRNALKASQNATWRYARNNVMSK
jgi:hypothetical protein